MDVIPSAAPSGGEAPVFAPKVGGSGEISLEQAARSLADTRYKREAEANKAPEENTTAEPEPTAPEPPNELASQEANASPEEVPSETQAADPAVEELPPIEPPRSWTKEDKELFKNLPRETQERVSERERSREGDFLRRQQEAADQRKAVDAEREAASKVRQQLEAAVSAAREVLEREQRARFPDIKSWEDYERFSAEASRLADTDPLTSLKISNYLKDFDTHQRSMQYNAKQAQEIEAQKAQERLSKRNAYETEQTKLLSEMVPEIADPKKKGELFERSVAMLESDLGLKRDQLAQWMQDDTGHEILSSAGIQKLIVDGVKYRDLQKAKASIIAKTLPPAQRPGAPSSANGGTTAQIQALEKQLATASPSQQLRIGAEITTLKRRAASR